MQTYLDALDNIITTGKVRKDRTGTGTIGKFGMMQRYNLQDGFPAVTTKKLAWKAVVSELLWFLEGSGDERRLSEILHGTRDSDKKTIWTANANSQYWKPNSLFEGDLGRVYGVQWRSWHGAEGEYDQISNIIHSLKADPFSRRHILSAWNPGELHRMALPPCHIMAQFHVDELSYGERVNRFFKDGHRYHLDPHTNDISTHLDELHIPRFRLSCNMYQRSADFFLGVPFNIASYSLLTHMIAQVCHMDVGEFIHTIGDAHVYVNHIDQVKEQLNRKPLHLPQLRLNEEIFNIDFFTMDDIELMHYESHPSIPAPMAV